MTAELRFSYGSHENDLHSVPSSESIIWVSTCQYISVLMDNTAPQAERLMTATVGLQLGRTKCHTGSSLFCCAPELFHGCGDEFLLYKLMQGTEFLRHIFNPNYKIFVLSNSHPSRRGPNHFAGNTERASE